MNVTKETIVRDWQNQFPILTSYTSSTLFVKADFVLLGLRIQNGKYNNEEYSVCFEAIPLWREEQFSIEWLIFYYELLNPLNQIFNVSYQEHINCMKTLMECARIQFQPLLRKEIEVCDIFYLLNKITTRITIKKHLYSLVSIFEFKLALALYLDNTELRDIVRNEIELESRNWDRKHFQRVFHTSIEEWKTSLFERMADREKFMACVEYTCAANKKIQKLREANFIWHPSMADTIRQQDKEFFHETVLQKLGRFLRFRR